MSSVEETVSARLAVCFREIVGVKRYFETPPEVEIQQTDLPAGYTLIGPIVNPIPFGAAGSVVVTRRYVVRLLIWPAGVTEDEADKGAQANQLVLPWYGKVRSYFMAHPRLDTSTLAELGLTSDVTLTDSGLAIRPGPGGGNFYGIEFTLTIAAREQATAISGGG